MKNQTTGSNPGNFALSQPSSDPQLSVISLSSLVQDVVDSFAGQLESSGCTFTWSRKETAYSYCDRCRLEQVVTNLVSNAIKYGNGKPITGAVYSDASLIHISLSDQGIGVAVENQERIFGQFERAISAENISGLGLGLYISQQIIVMHEGKISVESKVGRGSTFTIDLPLFEASLLENHGTA